MAAQIYLHFWDEPAQVIAVTGFDEERSLREVVFRRDGLHQVIVQPLLQWTDSRRIAAKAAVREGIDNIERDFHGGMATIGLYQIQFTEFTGIRSVVC